MNETKKKVGIMGGTFNPIHLGHLIIAEEAFEAYDLDEVLFVPSGISYMKDPSEVLDAKKRVHMTGLAIEDNPHFALSTIEIDRDGNSYSYETLETLRKQNPNTEYYFLVGADKEDIVQEGMIGLFKAIRDFKDEKLVSFKSFAEICVTRQIITAIKAATRQKHMPLNSYVSLNKPVFEDDGERVWIWNEVENVLLKYKKNFYQRED